MTTFMPIVSNVLFVVLLVGVPTVALLSLVKKREDLGKRMAISVFGTWAALVFHHWFLGHPVSLALAEARGNKNYDGAAIAGAIEFFGWIPAVFVTAIATGVYLLIQCFRHKRSAKAI